MAQLFLWREMLKNGELEDKARHARRQEILPKNREEGCERGEGRRESPDGRDKKCWPDETALS